MDAAVDQAAIGIEAFAEFYQRCAVGAEEQLYLGS